MAKLEMETLTQTLILTNLYIYIYIQRNILGNGKGVPLLMRKLKNLKVARVLCFLIWTKNSV